LVGGSAPRFSRGHHHDRWMVGYWLMDLFVLVTGLPPIRAASYYTIRTYDGSDVQTIFETCTFLVAAAILTYMTFWMRNHSRTISSELRARTEAVLGANGLNRGARRGLALLAFQAVGREGLETVVFTLAVVFSTSASGALVGAVIGLAGSLALAFVIYRMGHQINLALFFKVLGALLIVFAAGLLVDAVDNMQHLSWLPVLRQPLWNSVTSCPRAAPWATSSTASSATWPSPTLSRSSRGRCTSRWSSPHSSGCGRAAGDRRCRRRQAGPSGNVLPAREGPTSPRWASNC
ncbi:MAG: FTR1 family protein, partial [Actinomycetota bacterium]|nr:FTR1 family protein [Actinomycetota bacterium]